MPISAAEVHPSVQRLRSFGTSGPARSGSACGTGFDAQHPKHPPKSPLGVAIRYTLGQWDELGVFLEDARVPLDNNPSERSLRRIALGRKNYQFVGDFQAGKSLAGLYSLVATCESRGINPFDYLTDVLGRVQDRLARALDELLPGAWTPATWAPGARPRQDGVRGAVTDDRALKNHNHMVRWLVHVAQWQSGSLLLTGGEPVPCAGEDACEAQRQKICDWVTDTKVGRNRGQLIVEKQARAVEDYRRFVREDLPKYYGMEASCRRTWCPEIGGPGGLTMDAKLGQDMLAK